jgi:hypothetical protein
MSVRFDKVNEDTVFFHHWHDVAVSYAWGREDASGVKTRRGYDAFATSYARMRARFKAEIHYSALPLHSAYDDWQKGKMI